MPLVHPHSPPISLQHTMQTNTPTFIILIILRFLVHETKGLYYLPVGPGARYAYGAHTRPNISSYLEVKRGP